MKFSLILPVYNVENYLSKCIKSCLCQDIPYDDYEIIVVIDGSPDNSLEIAQRYAKDYANIKIIERENGGLSAARNSGLKIAKGEYIWFIDSDDFIETNILSQMYETLSVDQLDCLWVKWKQMNEKNVILRQYTPYIKKQVFQIMSGLDFMSSVLSNHLYAWSFIYNRSFLCKNNLTFTEGMFYEDTDFALRALPLVNRIKLYDKVCYSYLFREGSITHVISSKKLNDILQNVNNEYSRSINEKNKALKDFYTLGYSCFVLLALKEVAKSENKNLEEILLKNLALIAKVKVLGNSLTKLLCVIYNIFGAHVSYRLAKQIYRHLYERRSRN